MGRCTRAGTRHQLPMFVAAVFVVESTWTREPGCDRELSPSCDQRYAAGSHATLREPALAPGSPECIKSPSLKTCSFFR